MPKLLQAFAWVKDFITEGNASICFDLMVLGSIAKRDAKMCKSQANFDESANFNENA